MNSIKRVSFACYAILFTWLFMVPIVVFGEVDGDIKKSFDIKPGGWLKLESDIGSIDVKTGQRNQVEVEVLFSLRSGNGDRLQELLDDFDIDFRQSGNDVIIQAEYQKDRWNLWNSDRNTLRVEFRVTVPSKYNLDLETAGGSIRVDDLEGEVHSATSGGSLNFGRITGLVSGKTSGGSITLSQCKGNVDVHTSGGSIRIGQVEGDVLAKTSGGGIHVDEVMGTIDAGTSGGSVSANISQQPDSDCQLRTSGGSITVHLKPSVRLNIDARTSGGRVVTDFPVTVQGELSKQSLVGQINGGGPELILRTSGGSISIRQM